MLTGVKELLSEVSDFVRWHSLILTFNGNSVDTRYWYNYYRFTISIPEDMLVMFKLKFGDYYTMEIE